MVTRVGRIIVYEGEETAVQRQLGQSLPDGIRSGGEGTTITIVTLPPAWMTLLLNIGQSILRTKQSPVLPDEGVIRDDR